MQTVMRPLFVVSSQAKWRRWTMRLSLAAQYCPQPTKVVLMDLGCGIVSGKFLARPTPAPRRIESRCSGTPLSKPWAIQQYLTKRKKVG